jgi:hypothetical protein
MQFDTHVGQLVSSKEFIECKSAAKRKIVTTISIMPLSSSSSSCWQHEANELTPPKSPPKLHQPKTDQCTAVQEQAEQKNLLTKKGCLGVIGLVA